MSPYAFFLGKRIPPANPTANSSRPTNQSSPKKLFCVTDASGKEVARVNFGKGVAVLIGVTVTMRVCTTTFLTTCAVELGMGVTLGGGVAVGVLLTSGVGVGGIVDGGI